MGANNRAGERPSGRLAVGGTLVDVLGHHAGDERVDGRRNPARTREDGCLAEHDLGQDGHHVVAGKGRASCDALEEHTAEREHVDAWVGVSAIPFGLLGSHIAGRPEKNTGARRVLGTVSDSGDAKMSTLSLGVSEAPAEPANRNKLLGLISR